MMRMDEAVVEGVRALLETGLTLPDDVRAYGFRPDIWRRWVGDVPAASSVIDDFETDDAPAGGQIGRRDLVSLSAAADESDIDSVVRLFVATMIWGSGTGDNRGAWRTASALADDRLLPSLTSTRRLILGGDPVAAYASFRGSRVGPSFFTKWFWAAGLDRALDPTPLILDEQVWASLGALGWDSRVAAGSRRRAKRYGAYLESMRRWAAALPSVTTVEQLEQILFESAGRL